MCRTMNELEKVIADYRSLKALKEDLEEQLKDIEREIIGYMDSNEKLAETGKDFTIKLSTCERGQTAERNYKNMAKKITKAMREDFKKCEELANKIMEEFDIEIPFLTWAFMTYEELLELEEELKNK